MRKPRQLNLINQFETPTVDSMKISQIIFHRKHLTISVRQAYRMLLERTSGITRESKTLESLSGFNAYR
jgi:hypothetical protein